MATSSNRSNNDISSWVRPEGTLSQLKEGAVLALRPGPAGYDEANPVETHTRGCILQKQRFFDRWPPAPSGKTGRQIQTTNRPACGRQHGPRSQASLFPGLSMSPECVRGFSPDIAPVRYCGSPEASPLFGCPRKPDATEQVRTVKTAKQKNGGPREWGWILFIRCTQDKIYPAPFYLDKMYLAPFHSPRQYGA